MVSFRAIAVALLASSLATNAYAQDDTSAAGEAPVAASNPNEIIVSARRRAESIQDTPVAVTAITPMQLEAVGTTTLADIQGLAPNTLITTQSTGAATANISIRGIAFADVDKSFDPAVGVNVDGVYIGTSTGQMLDFFDIESIEILRGPQGTLFGRNTIAGVINVRRTRPTGEWGGKFEASIGSYGRVGLRGIVNVPVVPDLLAVKLFEMHEQNDGYLRDADTGKHVGGSNSENFGISALLTPSNNFDALLTLEQQESDFDPRQGSLIQPGDVFCGAVRADACGRNNTDDIYTVFDPGFTPYGKYRSRAAMLEMNLDLGFTELTSVSSYRESDEDQRQDFGSVGLYDALRLQTYWQASQELRAAGDLFDGFDYVAGLYYFESKYNLQQYNSVFFAPRFLTQDTTGKSRSYAGFVDLNWEIAPGLRISGGGRYTKDRKTLANATIADPDGNLGISASESWSKFTPKVGVDYRPSDEFMVYASWSRGYRSGGFSGRGQTFFSATTPYDPELVDAYELGIKSDLFAGLVTLNLAGFYTDYTNIQQSTTITADTAQGNETIVTNAAGAKIKGVEADLTVRPAYRWNLRTSVGYTDASFGDFLSSVPVGGELRQFDYSNVDLIYAPKITAAVSTDYTFDAGPGELSLSATFRYLSRYDQQIAADPATVIPDSGVVVVERNDPRVRSDNQYLADASISYVMPMGQGDAKVRYTLFARNIFDDRGTSTAFTVAAFPTLWGFAAAREPRVFGARVGFEF
ncbi:TonB-dependent receptor [Novosphingobium sp. YJ-S2-02]|uniref:TonB-dependent receptor n=1 Tax=Novosphingobium aureum TaxID=2792964 RepID=A0A931HEZ5_9SPHN|nr:TonB-dependent receptor [Novosphingobium aureum]MBH0114587.1 TonB-dependent receptor [Novosphingobium aureum]